jgi:hypothetical protein
MRAPPPPLSPELEALLAPNRTVLPIAPSVEARAVARAAATTQWAAHGAARVSAPPRWVFAAAAGAVLAMGAGAYAARAWIAASPPPLPARTSPPASPRATEATPVAAVPASEPADTIAPGVAPHPRRAVAKAHASTGRPTNEELQLLRAAREDVTRGDFDRALAVLSEHARRFRNGVLVEEREALRVKALAGLGRGEEAQRAAAQFHARFPHSVLLSTFERMNGKGADR